MPLVHRVNCTQVTIKKKTGKYNRQSEYRRRNLSFVSQLQCSPQKMSNARLKEIRWIEKEERLCIICTRVTERGAVVYVIASGKPNKISVPAAQLVLNSQITADSATTVYAQVQATFQLSNKLCSKI